ncbi:ceramide kinase-like isoform X2 [Acropora muricata]|uniref:ceramide kinase-like isoform X2 n=1 Tax=Acropora muricata TaxID=159855 RepID=UPI0034E60CBC
MKMATQQGETSPPKLKAVLKINGKLHDVFLDEEEIVWALQGELNAGSDHKAYDISTRSMKLVDVIGAWIAKRRSPNKQRNEGELVGFTLFTFAKAGNRKLSEARVTFECDDISVCEEWIEKINDTLQGFHERPRKLKVVINPRSKKGQARLVYLKQVAPLFDKAGIRADLMMTQRAGHAWEYFRTADLSTYDGVVCVGGDGIVHEVVNGLLEKSHGNVGIDLVDGTLPDNFTALPLSVRVGIIPAGSTEVVVFSAQGINDPVTSAIHIILGHTIPLDICSLWNDNKHIRFTFSLAYGFLGDVLKTSERNRWMGPKRYKWGAARRLWKMKSYDVEVSYLQSPFPEHHPRDQTRCRTGCEVCKDETSDAVTKQNQEWKAFHGRVVGVNFYTLPNLCEISPEGPSPSCHLGDGFTDLVIVKECSRLQMKSHIQRNFNYKDQFAFPFVECHRIKECHVKACDKSGYPVQGVDGPLLDSYRGSRNPKDNSVGTWNVDGEILRQHSLSLRVHRQLVTVFGSGIEDVSEQKCCLRK